MRRARIVASGAAVTLLLGAVGSMLPFLRTLAGPLAGGMLAGVRSADDRRLVNGFAAAAIGGAPLSFGLFVLVEGMVGSDAPVEGLLAVAPLALAFLAVMAVLGALAARFWTGEARAGSRLRGTR